MNKMTQVRISTLSDEAPMQASKWLSHQMLIDHEEMASFLDSLGAIYIYATGAVVKKGEELIAKKAFLSNYKNYIDLLQQGRIPDEALFRRQFAVVFTVTPDLLFSIAVDDERQLIRISKPVIQFQAHRMDYSKAEGKFRSMTFGAQSITWGLQLSYPQLYQDGKTKEIFSVDNSAEYPNTSLFRAMQLWVRNHTIPTQFIVEGKKITIPVRLGKKCLSWINQHPQLVNKGLQVFNIKEEEKSL